MCPAGLDLSDVGRVATATEHARIQVLLAAGLRTLELQPSGGMLCGTCLTLFSGGGVAFLGGKRHFDRFVTKSQVTGFNNVLDELGLDKSQH